MLTYEFVSSEWEKDYPKYHQLKKRLEGLPETTLSFENKRNKYWDYYQVSKKQLVVAESKRKKVEAVLKRYYSKKPLTEEEVNYFNLDPLNISFTKQEIDMMVRSHDKYCESEISVKSAEFLLEYTKDCLDFISKWGYKQKDFINLYRLINGYVAD